MCKTQMKSALVLNDLWPNVDGIVVKSITNADVWVNTDSKALALINMSITYEQLNHVKRATTSNHRTPSRMYRSFVIR